MRMTQGGLATAALATMIIAISGCGGGGGGSDTSSPSRQITPQALASCPTESMSAADMSKLSCLVGHADGVSNRQTNPKACSLDVDSDGTITINVADRGSRSYSLSKGAGTFKDTPLQSRGFSEYQGRGDVPGAPAGFATETWMLGSTTGSETPSGTAVPTAEQAEVKVTYFGPAGSGSAMQPILTVGAFKDGSQWIPSMMNCEVRW